MELVNQAQSFGDIRIEGERNTFIINQVVQISVPAVKTRPFIAASPYVGLKRFDAGNKDVFFGRDRLVAQLLNLTSQRNLVLVSGASGSGKSSVVRAGLIPQLAERLGHGRFHAFTMTPDVDPFDSLRAVLKQHPAIDSRKLTSIGAGTEKAFVETIERVRPSKDLWLLVVDQFEEIFTRCDDIERRAAFLNGLTRLALTPQTEVKMLLCMRADFFDRFGPHPEFGKLVEPGLCLVMDMQVNELRAAIEQPAARHGVVFEEGLVEQIIADVKGRPGTLPLLQYTLDLLWHEDKPADDRTLNAVNYHKIGGVEGALQRQADALYEWMDGNEGEPRPQEQKAALRRLFLRLLDLKSEGGQAVSKRTRISAFSREDEQSLIAELVNAKLLVSNASGQTAVAPISDATVELAHEALLSAWGLLKRWIEEGREVIYVHSRLSSDARHFSKAKARDPSRADEELWGGTRLAQALELRARGDFQSLLGGLAFEEKEFLNASEAFTTERLRREREAAERIHQLLLDSYIDRGHQLLFERKQPYAAALWLHRAYKEGSRSSALPYLLKSAMLQIDITMAVLNHGGSVYSSEFSPDGGYVVTASGDETARIWDSVRGQSLSVLTGHEGPIMSASFSPDGRRIVTAGSDCTVRIWDAKSGRGLAVLVGHEGPIMSASFSPDGRRIVTASDDWTARVWRVEDGQLLAVLRGHTDVVWSATFSPDSQRIVTGGVHRSARVWDAKDGRLLAVLTGHEGPIMSASFSLDGRRIITASDDETARLWGSEGGRPLLTLTGHAGSIMSASFRPDGKRIVTASKDHTARIWDAGDGQLVAVLAGHADAVMSANFNFNGQRIVTTSKDQMALVWGAEDGRLLTALAGHDGTVRSASFSPDGRRIVTASADNSSRIWNAEDCQVLLTLAGHEGTVRSASFSPDGRRIITASSDNSSRVWSVENRQVLTALTGHTAAVWSASFSRDSQRIVTASDDKTACVWDAESGRRLAILTGHQGIVYHASFSLDGRRIVTASSDKTACVWDVKDGRRLVSISGHADAVTSAVFDSSGRRIITASKDKTARIWDAGDGRLLATLTGHADIVWSAKFSFDGRRVITASSDKLARVWDAESGRLFTAFTGHTDVVWSANFSHDGQRIVTASSDRTARIWDTQGARLLSVLSGHEHYVLSASFSDDGSRIVTASMDNTVRVWDATRETRSPEALLQAIRCRSCLRFESEDGNVIVPCTPSPVDSQDRDTPAT